MKILKLIPLLLVCLLLGAHFLRANLMPLVLITLALPALLLFRAEWSTRLVQLCLVLGAVEWLRTLAVFVDQRMASGDSWMRLALILGSVALVTGLAAIPLTHIHVKKLQG